MSCVLGTSVLQMNATCCATFNCEGGLVSEPSRRSGRAGSAGVEFLPVGRIPARRHGLIPDPRLRLGRLHPPFKVRDLPVEARHLLLCGAGAVLVEIIDPIEERVSPVQPPDEEPRDEGEEERRQRRAREHPQQHTDREQVAQEDDHDRDGQKQAPLPHSRAQTQHQKTPHGEDRDLEHDEQQAGEKLGGEEPQAADRLGQIQINRAARHELRKNAGGRDDARIVATQVSHPPTTK